jgi:hypothetical protein
VPDADTERDLGALQHDDGDADADSHPNGDGDRERHADSDGERDVGRLSNRDSYGGEHVDADGHCNDDGGRHAQHANGDIGIRRDCDAHDNTVDRGGYVHADGYTWIDHVRR